MRRADKRATEDPQPDDGTSGAYASPLPRRSRRRKQAMIGAAGLVAILGAGTMTALQVNDSTESRETAGTGMTATLGGSSSVASTPALASTVPLSGAPSTAAADPNGVPSSDASATPRPKTTAERVAAGQSAAAKAAKDGYGVTRPLPVRNGGATVAANEVKVVESGSLAKDGRTLKVISARQDLTGQRELAWVADDGVRVGTSRCSNKIRLSVDAKPRVRPTLLLCWRISAAKTVYTVAVDVKQPPSKQASVAEINKVWSKLG